MSSDFFKKVGEKIDEAVDYGSEALDKILDIGGEKLKEGYQKNCSV